MTDSTYRTDALSPLPQSEPVPPLPPQRHPRRGAGLVALVLAGAVVGGGAGAAVKTALDGDRPAASPAPVTPVRGALDSTGGSSSGSVSSIAAKLLPSVVSIAVRGSSGAGVGTGVVYDAEGHVLTNNHVVAAAADGGTIQVRFTDGIERSATIVGRDPVTDLAVVQVKNPTGLRPATLGRSGGLAVGDPVVAFGSPLGLSGTVTSGIVSALDRPVSTGGSGNGGRETTSTVLDAIQTDAAINPGNSGGPLVNMRGEVVGINSAIATLGAASAGGESGSIGLGFSIPIDQAKPVADELIATGKAQHSYLGVSVSDATGNASGAVLSAVTAGGSAAKAGLQPGDVVTAVGDRPMTSADALVAAVRSYRPGQQVEIRYLRGGTATHTATVTLAVAPY